MGLRQRRRQRRRYARERTRCCAQPPAAPLRTTAHAQPPPPPTPAQRCKTLPDQWRLLQSPWRYATALFPYLGPPLFTLRHICVPVMAVMIISVGIKQVGGHASTHMLCLSGESGSAGVLAGSSQQPPCSLQYGVLL